MTAMAGSAANLIAELNVDLFASPIDAGYNADVWAYGSITGPVSAGSNATAFAGQNVDGTIDAGQAVSATALVSVTGQITAGASADVTAFADASGPVAAGTDASVFALGNILSDPITAGTGNVDAVAFGNITSSMTAGANVTAFAKGNLTVASANAGGSAALTGLGISTDVTFVTAAQDVYVTAFGTLNAPAVTAGRDADLLAMGPTVVDVTATNVSVLSTGDVQANVVASEDASVASLGASLQATVSAGSDGGLYSGGAVLSTMIDAGTDAAVLGLSDVSLGQLVSGGDATLYALGNVSADASVGGSLWAAADGNLSGDYTVQNDIEVLWARGDITGTYTSRDNVRWVVSHGGISAAITAGGLAEPTDDDADGYGVSEYVGAWNDVAGSLTADTSIDEVIAGGVVSATLNAPTIGAVVENDRTGFEYWDQLHPISFDSLNSVTAELQYFNSLLTGAVSDAAAATDRAMAAYGAEASEELTEAIAEIALAHSAAALHSALLDGRLAEASASAQSDSDRAKSDVQKAVDAALTELHASEANAQAVVSTKLLEAKNRVDAGWNSALERRAAHSGFGGILEGVAENLKAQYDKIVQAQVDDVEILANDKSRKMTYCAGAPCQAAVMRDLGLPEYTLARDATLDGFDRANEGVETLASLNPGGIPLFFYKTVWGKNLLGRELTVGQRIWSGVEVALWFAPAILGAVGDWIGNVRHADDVVRYSDDAAAARELLESSVDLAHNAPNSAGTYRAVKGHHVHAKKAFEGIAEYNFRDALSLSDDLLRQYGIRHADLTPIQQRLFRELATSGRPNNLTQHTRIAYRSLVEAGMPKKDALNYVSESLKDLIRRGVVEPSKMPWNPGWTP